MADEWMGSRVLMRAAERVTRGWAQGTSSGVGVGGRHFDVEDDPGAVLAWSPTGAIEWSAIEMFEEHSHDATDQGVAALATWLQRQGPSRPPRRPTQICARTNGGTPSWTGTM